MLFESITVSKVVTNCRCKNANNIVLIVGGRINTILFRFNAFAIIPSGSHEQHSS